MASAVASTVSIVKFEAAFARAKLRIAELKAKRRSRGSDPEDEVKYEPKEVQKVTFKRLPAMPTLRGWNKAPHYHHMVRQSTWV